MKIKVIKEAFYNNAYKKIGDVLDYQGENIPSWAILANGKDVEKQKKEEKPLDNVGQDNKKEGETPVNPDENIKDGLDNVGQNDNNNSDDCDLQLKLEQYKNIGVDNNILLPVENLSVKDAVELFENEFKKKGIDLK